MMSQQTLQCEQCQQRYNLFRRKKQCDLCGQIFCSKCAPKSRLNVSRACLTCLLIVNERTTRDQLSAIRIRHLRAYLIHSQIISRNRLELLIEKQDLVNLIESKKRQIPDETFVILNHSDTNPDIEAERINNQQEVEERITNQNEQVSSLNDASSASAAEPVRETTVELPPPPAAAHCDRITLSELSSIESIHDLTIRQLKDILVQNFVSIKGCVEKHELIHRVELLYRDQKQQEEEKESNPATSSNENLCKVCMDANIDCVFLDCGHLCTCVQCGKRLSECPLCRCYIIRVVRVFKS